jgi:hypothetical protein
MRSFVRPPWKREAAPSARTPSPEWSASAAGARAKRNIDEDDDDCQKSKPSHPHHAGIRNGSRSLRFDPGHGGYGDDHDCNAQQCEPIHDSPCYKMRASRARSDTRRGSGSSRLLHLLRCLYANVVVSVLAQAAYSSLERTSARRSARLPCECCGGPKPLSWER